MGAAALEALLAEGDGLARPVEPEHNADEPDHEAARRLRVVGED
jgi:hypothetical protein